MWIVEDLFREYLEPSCDNKNKQNGFKLTKAALELAKTYEATTQVKHTHTEKTHSN